MPANAETSETILLVDDEEPVRKTFREWLEGSGFPCRILTAADAEAALVLANKQTIDLAILDWNLGAGNDGLHLLEDLYLFNPDVVAILVTGFAHQATPLDAMRMGVRDYLDKNQQLDRTTFLTAVSRQLERIRPVKRERRLRQSLSAFREAVEKVLPLVRSAQVLNDPVPLPDAIGSLFRFLLRTTNARDGVLLVRSYDPNREPAESYRAYDATGQPLNVKLAPFARSIAGSVVSLQEPFLLAPVEKSSSGEMELQAFERGRSSLLAAPLAVGAGTHVVFELFDKQKGTGGPAETGFSIEDRRLAAGAADIGAELLRQALAKEQVHQILIDAMESALHAGESVAQTLHEPTSTKPQDPLPPSMLDQLREGFTSAGATLDGAETLRLAEAIRVLAVKHGPVAVEHCIQLVESLRTLLDRVTDGESSSSR
jgi:two-component system nitrogen regulation response regulator NtrX